MFCSNCGKKINLNDHICSNCGAENETLKGFKKLDSNIALSNNQRQNQYNSKVETKIVYRDNPAQTRVIYRWRALALLFCVFLAVTGVIEVINIHSKDARINDQAEQIQHLQDIQSNSLTYSKEKYDFTGILQCNEYKQYFIALPETQRVTINENTYLIDAVYLSPTTDILQYCKIDEEVSVNGNVCKISNGQFMTISDVFVNTQKSVNTKDTKEE